MALTGTNQTYTDEDLALLTLMRMLSLDPANAPEDMPEPEEVLKIAFATADNMIKINPNLKEKVHGEGSQKISPLHALLQTNGQRCSQELFCNFFVLAKINEKSGGGWATIHFLAYHNRADLLAILVEQKGFDINLRTDKKQTALFIAAQRGHYDVVALLLSKKANCYLGDMDGLQPIHVACEKAHRPCIELLLKHDLALARARTISGRTPAHYVAQNTAKNLAQEDLEAILDLLRPTLAVECNDDTTPIELAKYLGKKDVEAQIKPREILSLYQLCQKQICEQYNTQDFNVAKLNFPKDMREALEKKKSRLY